VFYHYPKDDLLTDGKPPWREFEWQQGILDSDLVDKEFDPVTAFYGFGNQLNWRRRDDEDEDRGHKHPRSHSILKRMSGWMDNSSNARSRGDGANRGSGWYRGEPSHGRNRAILNQPSMDIKTDHANDAEVEAFPELHYESIKAKDQPHLLERSSVDDVIVIVPHFETSEEQDLYHSSSCTSKTIEEVKSPSLENHIWEILL
jgi:hypothetical protein